MTWVDFVVFAVLFVSALLAFLRGLVRELLGIAAWAGALYVALTFFHHLEGPVRGVIPDAAIADPVAFGALFLVALIGFSLVAALLGRLARGSALGGLDRTLGLVYGLARGAVLVTAAYIVGQWVSPVERWPAPVRDALSLPLVYEGANWMAEALRPACTVTSGEACRLHVEAPPGRQTRAEDLLRVRPDGYALGSRAPSKGAGSGSDQESNR